MNMLDWRESAACRGRGSWYIPPGKTRKEKADRITQVAAAVQICLGCPVRVPCAQVAVETDVCGGIWAGVDLGDTPRPLSQTNEDALQQLKSIAGLR